MSMGWRIFYPIQLALFFLFLGRLSCADPVRVSLPLVCPLNSVKDFIVDTQNDLCLYSGVSSSNSIAVIEGDEVALQKVLLMVHTSAHEYVALLFYASWCPFSATFRPRFSVLSSIFPTIPHFTIEESAVKPSTLSKYGVHGFPTLVLLNSTVRMRYQGSRKLDSLISFYSDFTGIKPSSADGVSLDKIGCSGYRDAQKPDPEICPFPWARSPENILQQETYLALATIFVILRLLYFIFPTLRKCPQFPWRKYILNMNLNNLWDHHPMVYLNRVIQSFNSLKKPCKKSNLQEGAKNAKEWASKSLATVSFGDASSSRETTASCVH